MNGLAYENISDIPHDTQCDARTILQIEKRNKQAINLLSNELSIIKESGELVREQNNDLSNNLKSMKDDVSILLQLMQQQNPTNPLLLESSSTSKTTESNPTLPINDSPHDLTLNHSFRGWFVNNSICQNKNVIEIFIHWNKYSLSSGHVNDKKNKTTHTSFAKYSKMYKTMESILQPTSIDDYPHNNIPNQIIWEKKYTTLLSAKFIELRLVGKSKKGSAMTVATINCLEDYAKKHKINYK